MKRLSKAVEIYKSGDWSNTSVRIDLSTDEAIIVMIDKSGKKWEFKVKDYSKGQEKWKIIEDEE